MECTLQYNGIVPLSFGQHGWQQSERAILGMISRNLDRKIYDPHFPPPPFLLVACLYRGFGSRVRILASDSANHPLVSIL